MKEIRRSGVLVPLFSLTSTRSWGVGEFRDLPAFAGWLADAGQSFVQILPITEIPDAETSPYSAMTAMALDPIHIALDALEDFAALGGEASLTAGDRAVLQRVRAAPRVVHREIRGLKARQLARAFERFAAEVAGGSSQRSRQFAAFVERESSWLEDYALFHVLRARHGRKPWWEWPRPHARRTRAAMDRVRKDSADEIEYLRYVQWVAAAQWAEARREAAPIALFGDLPFMISADSPDVWTRQPQFRFDATVGVPPDAFSDTGQDWGLPPWRHEVMAADGFAWMRERARRSASLFDGFRLDHLVGLYRTYIRPLDEKTPAFFAPADEPAQIELGERLVGLYQASGAEIVAEDLGTVPDFVRASLDRLGVPGFKVLRWEREWTIDGHPFIDPAEYRAVSVATTGTHDTEPLVCWWEELAVEERERVLEMPSVASRLDPAARGEALGDTLSPAVHAALIRAVLESPSRLVILPVQDVFGWRERINTPATVSDDNWTWRLPIPVDRLRDHAEAAARARALGEWSRSAGRV